MARVRSSNRVVFLNARTCGIYKNGGPRYKTDAETGRRTDEIDNELNELVDAYLAGSRHEGIVSVSTASAMRNRVLVPTYYDRRHEQEFEAVISELGWDEITLGELIASGIISSRGGHGSPGNDQRKGHIPYIKVSDIRALRVNVNPTNLVSEQIAKRFWRGDDSGLEPFDLVTPNRASSNIGEFAMLLPGEERIVVTKEVFVFRVESTSRRAVWDPFVLLWALCLRGVREQWRRVALMQTNREDCGARHLEVRLPLPPNRAAARDASSSFRQYFSALAQAKQDFGASIANEPGRYIASVAGGADGAPGADEEADGEEDQSG